MAENLQDIASNQSFSLGEKFGEMEIAGDIVTSFTEGRILNTKTSGCHSINYKSWIFFG